MFLILLENEVYALIWDLCTPSKLIDRSYNVLKQMSRHINPKPNMLMKRYKFKEKKQELQESGQQLLQSFFSFC